MYAGQKLSETAVSNERKGKQVTAVQVVENYETRTLTQRVKIPSSKMLDKSSLRYTIHLIDSNDMVVGRHKGKAPYDAEFQYLSCPAIKPGISASIQGDRLRVSYTQNDSSGVKIKIFYRSVSQGSPFRELTTARAVYLDSGEISTQLRESMAGILLVRAISFSTSGMPGAFADCISSAPERLGGTQTGLISPSVFGAVQTGNVIKVNFDIPGLTPGGHMRAYICRKDYKVGKNGIPALISQQESVDITERPSSSLNDSNVRDGFYYEYSIILRNGFSASTGVRINSNNVLVHYMTPPDWVSVKVDSAAATGTQLNGESGASVEIQQTNRQYELIADLSETKTDSFFKFLKKHSLEDIYDEDLKKVREKLSQFLVFKVERVSRSGTVDLGFFLPGLFKDPRPSGTKCSYIFKLYAGNKTHILESLQSHTNSNIPYYLLEDSRSESLQNQTNIKASKTIFNIGNSEYSSVHESSNVSGETFDLHYTGAQASVLYEQPGSRAISLPSKPGSVRLGRLTNGVNRVTWTINNEMKIDHFIIVSRCNGSLSIAGTMHHVSSNTGKYVFFDERFSDAIGEISYGIIAVNTSVTISKPIFSRSITMR